MVLVFMLIVGSASPVRSFHSPAPSVTATPHPIRRMLPRALPRALPIVDPTSISETVSRGTQDSLASASSTCLRFTVANHSSYRLAIMDISRSYARVDAYDSGGHALIKDRSIMGFRPFLRPPVVGVAAGSTFTSACYPLSEWGIALSKSERYLLEVTPTIRALNTRQSSPPGTANGQAVNIIVAHP